MAHICTRCNAKFKNGHEFDMHTCKGMRDLSKLNKDLLLKVIQKELTEAQAWEIQDAA